jgi:hypothetical protein
MRVTPKISDSPAATRNSDDALAAVDELDEEGGETQSAGRCARTQSSEGR